MRKICIIYVVAGKLDLEFQLPITMKNEFEIENNIDSN